MKKIVISLVLLVVAFAVVIPSSAAGNGTCTGLGSGNGPGAGIGAGSGQGQPGGRGVFAIAGIISALDDNTVTINVLHGNYKVQPTIGSQLAVTVTTQTRYLLRDGSTTTTISLADLQVGQAVSVNGILVEDAWTALRITAGASLDCTR